jgi:hypothetical protein
MTKKVTSITGQELREMFAAATAWLEKNAPDIDELNVFPVPDGDTGTNMLLTMRSSVEEAYRAPDHSASAIAQALAKGALLGARGNSGVILSQIFRGMAEDMVDKEEITGAQGHSAKPQKSLIKDSVTPPKVQFSPLSKKHLPQRLRNPRVTVKT